MTKLDQEEQEILDAFESGNLKQSKNAKQIQKRHQSYAEASRSAVSFRPKRGTSGVEKSCRCKSTFTP